MNKIGNSIKANTIIVESLYIMKHAAHLAAGIDVIDISI